MWTYKGVLEVLIVPHPCYKSFTPTKAKRCCYKNVLRIQSYFHIPSKVALNTYLINLPLRLLLIEFWMQSGKLSTDWFIVSDINVILMRYVLSTHVTVVMRYWTLWLICLSITYQNSFPFYLFGNGLYSFARAKQILLS